MADKKIKNKSVLKKVFSYIGKYKYYLILSMLFAAVTVGLTLYAPILVGHAIDCIVGKDNVDFDLMKSILIKVAIIVIATAIIQWLMNVCNNKITYNVSRDLRKKAFEKIEVLPFSYIDTHSKGDIVSRVITDVDQLSDGLLMGFTQFFTGVITIIGTLAFMLSVNVFITIVVVIVTPLSFFIARFIAKKTFNMFSLQTKTRGEQTAFIDEMVSNQKVADAYSMDDENKKRCDEINDDLAKYSLKATFFLIFILSILLRVCYIAGHVPTYFLSSQSIKNRVPSSTNEETRPKVIKKILNLQESGQKHVCPAINK